MGWWTKQGPAGPWIREDRQRSERWIGDGDVAVSDALVTDLVLQDDLVVRPDPITQIIEKFNHGECLIWRPVLINQQFKAIATDSSRFI